MDNSPPFRSCPAWQAGMEFAREVHVACATYSSEHPDDLLRDMRREASLLPGLVAESAVRPAEDAREVLVDALAGLARVETIGALVIELGHLKADLFDAVEEGARAFEQAVRAKIDALDVDG